MARLKALLALLILVSSTALPLIASSPALAGDRDDPEMEDAAGDAVNDAASKDLLSGWVTNETESTFEVVLDLAALDPFTPLSEWQTLPVIYYEFFFDVNTPQGTGYYSAKATIPVHGPAAAFSQFELFMVNYTSSGTVTAETSIDTIVGAYQVASSTISMTVDKSLVGDPGRDDTVTGMWARTQSASQRNAGDAITADVMMSHLAPGRMFTLTGGITFYSISLSANVTATNATPDVPARFYLTISSSPESDKTANVTLRNSSALPANWTMTTDRQLYVVAPGETIAATVTITPGGNTTNITRRITVGGQFRDDQGELSSTDNTVTLSVTIPPGTGPSGCLTPPCSTSKPAADNTVVIMGLAAAGAAVVAALLIVVAWYLPSRRDKAARASYAKIAQLKLAKSPRSGALPGRSPVPGGRPGMMPAPRPGGAPRPAVPGGGPRGPGPGAAPRSPPGGMPRGPSGSAQRPVPRRR